MLSKANTRIAGKMKIVFLVSVLLSCGRSIGQDIHFSQYNETPTLLNPALTGAASNFRLAAIYKSQWGSVTVPYQTYGAMYEMKFKLSAWAKVDNHLTEIYKKAFRKLAGGIDLFSDKAGDGNMGSTRFDLSLSSQIPLSVQQNLAVGLMGGFVQRSIDFSKLIWPDQYNGSGYNPALNSGENFGTSNYINGDFAGGFLWNYRKDERAIRSNNQSQADAGIAFYHINKPRMKFLGNDVRTYRKLVIHSKVLFGIKYTNVSLVPSVLFEFAGPSKELTLGTMIKYHFDDDSKFTGYIHGNYFDIGMFYRNNDAFIFSTMFEFKQYALGVSYDVNISKLHAASTYRGGFEISLRLVGATPYIFQNSSRF